MYPNSAGITKTSVTHIWRQCAFILPMINIYYVFVWPVSMRPAHHHGAHLERQGCPVPNRLIDNLTPIP